MGANVWEWVDIPDKLNKGTRGGSWWYGARQMKADYNATKPRDMAVVYIGFRCVNGSKVDVSAYKKWSAIKMAFLVFVYYSCN